MDVCRACVRPLSPLRSSQASSLRASQRRRAVDGSADRPQTASLEIKWCDGRARGAGRMLKLDRPDAKIRPRAIIRRGAWDAAVPITVAVPAAHMCTCRRWLAKRSRPAAARQRRKPCSQPAAPGCPWRALSREPRGIDQRIYHRGRRECFNACTLTDGRYGARRHREAPKKLNSHFAPKTLDRVAAR